jgi:hypothetical protein
MYNINKLRVAIDILATHPQFISVSFIGELRWKVIPEAYKFEKTIVLGMYRVNIYSLGDTQITDIEGLGTFQIL